MKYWIQRISSWAGWGLVLWLVLAFSGMAPDSPWVPLALLLLWISGSPLGVLLGILLGIWSS